MSDVGQIFGGPLSAVLPTIDNHRIGALVSIINEATMIDTPPSLPAKAHLKLAVNDISKPSEGLVLPGETHIERLIEFIDGWDQSQPLLVHCWAGISRSTAGIFIALCQLNPERSEEEIALRLRQASPTAHPNIRMVILADRLLGRNGRMEQAITALDIGEMVIEGDVFSLPAHL